MNHSLIPSPRRHGESISGTITRWILAFAGIVISSSAPAHAAGALFAENCSACHQPDGKGIPGAFPALAGDKFVIGDPTGPVGVVLSGRGGMPTFADQLSDAQIAEVLTDVRSSWGNKAKPVTPDFVAKVRGGVTTDKPVTLQAH